MLLSPMLPFGAGLAIRSRDTPPISPRCAGIKHCASWRRWDRKTLRKYTAPAVAAGLVPGGPPMDEADWRGGHRMVPNPGGSSAAAGVVAGHRAAPRLHRRPVEGGGDGRDDPSAVAR